MNRMLRNKAAALALAVAGALGAVTEAAAQSNEIFIPVIVYRTGAYAPNGVPWADGYVDYLKLVNERDGGVNGLHPQCGWFSFRRPSLVRHPVLLLLQPRCCADDVRRAALSVHAFLLEDAVLSARAVHALLSARVPVWRLALRVAWLRVSLHRFLQCDRDAGCDCAQNRVRLRARCDRARFCRHDALQQRD